MKEKIEKILLHLGISPSQFADELGVQRSGISHILSERNKPSLEFVQKVLTKYKEINPEWLISGKGDMLRASVQRSLFSQTLDIPEEKEVAVSVNEQKNIVEIEIENEKKDLTKGTLGQSNELNPLETKATDQIQTITNIFDNNKDVEKIVFFYKDKTFCVYKPE